MTHLPKIALALSLVSSVASAATFDVFKSETCGCCTAWVATLEEAGHTVREHHGFDINMIKDKAGVPAGMGSCHTAAVDGYFVEGHVPVADIERMLEQRPDIRGLAVPGMPMSSPGMNRPGEKPVGFNVYSVSETDTAVYTAY